MGATAWKTERQEHPNLYTVKDLSMQHKLDDHKRAFEITEKGDGKANTA